MKRKATDAPVKSKRAAKRPKSDSKTGKVAPSRTTLSLYASPFPRVKYVSFDYSNGLGLRTPVSNTDVIAFACNDMFDFDRTTGYLANKQPLFFDNLLGANGPYKYYKVLSWVTEFTIINSGTAPITVWLSNAANASEIDSVVEVDNLPGVVKKFISAPSGPTSVCTISNKGNIKDEYYSQVADAALTGTYGTGPSTVVHGSLVLYSSSTLVYEVAVKHIAYTQLTILDATLS